MAAKSPWGTITKLLSSIAISLAILNPCRRKWEATYLINYPWHPSKLRSQGWPVIRLIAFLLILIKNIHVSYQLLKNNCFKFDQTPSWLCCFVVFCPSHLSMLYRSLLTQFRLEIESYLAQVLKKCPAYENFSPNEPVIRKPLSYIHEETHLAQNYCHSITSSLVLPTVTALVVEYFSSTWT